MAEIAFAAPGKPQGAGRPPAYRAGAQARMDTPNKNATYENRIRTCRLAARSRMERMEEAPKAPAGGKQSKRGAGWHSAGGQSARQAGAGRHSTGGQSARQAGAGRRQPRCETGETEECG